MMGRLIPEINIYFEPRDLWIGVYWTRIELISELVDEFRIYICLIPRFPIRLVWLIDLLREPGESKPYD